MSAFWLYRLVAHTHPFAHFPFMSVVLFIAFPLMGAVLVFGLVRDFLGVFRK